jgi:hypothetical protein
MYYDPSGYAMIRCTKKVIKGRGNGNNILYDIKYTDKVKEQMLLRDYHGFPKSVDAFGHHGKISQIIGGDNKVRLKVEILGKYKGKSGVFEYIIEADGFTCNDRLFKAILRR